MGLALLLVPLAACGAGAGRAGPAPGTPGGGAPGVEVYAGRDWYRGRPEPEEDLRGRLETQEPPVGPGARSLLTHLLVTDSGERLPLYVAGVGPLLAPFVGHRVVVTGKRVDLSAEGFGNELWAGSIRRAGDGSGPP